MISSAATSIYLKLNSRKIMVVSATVAKQPGSASLWLKGQCMKICHPTNREGIT